MEYYPTVKKSDIMNFTGKWMELEKIILSLANPDPILSYWRLVAANHWMRIHSL